MNRRVAILWSVLLNSCFIHAQKVLYSPVIDDRYTSHFEIAGKTSAFYWVLKEEKTSSKHYAFPRQHFEIFDSRLKPVNNQLDFILTGNTEKEYLIAGKNHFDKMLIIGDTGKTDISLQRFSEDGSQFSPNKIILSLPFNEPGNSFLLLRSEDKSKIMLLCFESVPDSPPKLHTILFDENWHQLLYKTYQHPFITQPVIQDDFTCYPIESFDCMAIQLANNGQWLMAAPSRTSNNFLLFHFCDDGSGFSYKEIMLPPASDLEDLSLTINNARGEASAGLLSKFHYRALKNIQVVHYSMVTQGFDFDSAYRFNTLSGSSFKNENLVQERLVAIPGSGFLLLKEYGRSFQSTGEDNGWDPSLFFAENVLTDNTVSIYSNNEVYTKFNKLASGNNEYHRGDLALFYFPAQSKDSCWRALISKQQITEMNSPNLSYVLFPEKEKLALLYNSFLNDGEEQYGSSTFLDKQGNIINDGGIIFWKFNVMLNFQQARQISGDEVAVPYHNNQRLGFAIIGF
ncbi:MAG TPA: hypothetical protein VMT76_04425 [Puia sp.]|nr:hypothetical protein [Puia sp.]